jgi:O-antigen/teichoic acid export membrane protein
VFTAACALLAGPLAALYDEPRVESLFVLISPVFVLTALGSTHTTLLTREMDFKSLEIRMMLGTLAGAAVGVTAAAMGVGSEAIIIQYLITAATSTVLVWVTLRWRPSLIFSTATLRSLGGYSARVFGSRVLFYVSRNADSLLIGRFLGPAALGAYTVAYNVMLVPFSKLAGPIQEVMFPAMARIQDDRRRIGSIWLRVNHIVAAFALPGMLGLIVIAPEFVSVVLGDRWQAAVTPIQILAWVGVLQSLVRLNGSVQQACDRTDVMFRWSLLIASANLVAFAVGVSWGIVGVAVAYALTNTLLQPVNVWLTGRIVGISLATFCRNLAGTVRATAVMLAAIVPLRQLLVAEDVADSLRLAAVVVVGGAVYALAAALLDRPLLDELRSLRRGRAPRAVASPAPAS